MFKKADLAAVFAGAVGRGGVRPAVDERRAEQSPAPTGLMRVRVRVCGAPG